MRLFFLGVLLGLILTVILIVLILFFIYKNEKRICEKSVLNLDIVDDKVKEIIYLEENRFINSIGLNHGFLEGVEIFKKTFLEIAKSISKEYNPNSKYPEFELTLIELLEINKATSEYLIESLNEKPFIILKNLRIAQLMEGNVKLNLIRDFLENHKYGNLVKNTVKHWDKISAIKNIHKMVTSPEKKILSDLVMRCTRYTLNYTLRGIGVKALEKAGKELNVIYSGKYYRGEKDE